MKKNVVFLNTYSNTGIGDFGQDLQREIIDLNIATVEVISTNSNLHALFQIWKIIIKRRDPVIMNLGFTSFGKSPILNFLNFLFIGFVSLILNYQITIVLHDSPSIVNPRYTGYKYGRILTIGGNFATLLISRCKIIVFSHQLYLVLKNKFKNRSVKFFPFPCSKAPIIRSLDRSKKNLVVSIGYLAPYKGLDSLVDIKKILSDYEFIIIGSNHKTLSAYRGGKEYFDKLRFSLAHVGIRLPGFMSEFDIKDLIKDFNCIGILPYKYTSGSSFSAIFMMELGIPVITSPLTEFLKLRELGAGIIYSIGTPEDYAVKIEGVLNNEEEYNSLICLNAKYCEYYSLLKLANIILDDIRW